MPRQERPAPGVFNALLDPLPVSRTARRRLRPAEPQSVAQDYLQYMLSDYERRRARGGARTWRDLCPAYAFALSTHAANWPRGGHGTDGELAAHWEQMRGTSRLDWHSARAVVEDAWLALDHMPASALRPLLQ